MNAKRLPGASNHSGSNSAQNAVPPRMLAILLRVSGIVPPSHIYPCSSEIDSTVYLLSAIRNGLDPAPGARSERRVRRVVEVARFISVNPAWVHCPSFLSTDISVQTVLGHLTGAYQVVEMALGVPSIFS